VRRFYLPTDPAAVPVPGDTVLLDKDESHHLLGVRRRGADESIGLVDGRGHLFAAELSGRRGKQAELRLLSVSGDAGECAAPRLRLACGVIKGRRWDQVLEKAVELGAHAICPLLTEHGVVEPRSGRSERWQALLRAALKQCGRLWLPDLAEPESVGVFLGRDLGGPLWWGAVPGERGGVMAFDPPPASAWHTVAIGPEGGWSAAEREALAAAGAVSLDLGPHVLRTETAAAAGLTILQRARGRVQGI